MTEATRTTRLLRWMRSLLVLVAAGLAMWLAVDGPEAVRRRAIETLRAEQGVLAHQAAARIGETLHRLLDRLADPALRAASGIEVARDPGTVRRALAAVQQHVRLPEGTVLFVHDADGHVVAATGDVLGAATRPFEQHPHIPEHGAWREGAGLCRTCFERMHRIAVASPLGAGRFLAAALPIDDLVDMALTPIVQPGRRRAWLSDDGTVLYVGAAAQPPPPDDEGWVRAVARLPRPAPPWEVHVAASAAALGAPVLTSAQRLLATAASVVVLLALAALLGLVEMRRRHAADLARAAELAHQDKLVTLGSLTAGLGHEIRNLVTALAGNLDLMRSAPTIPTEFGEDLRAAGEAADRLRELAADLTRFGRRDADPPAPRPLHEAVDEALRILRPALRHRGTVRFDRRATPVVSQVGGQLTQVFVNLIRNALDAMQPNPGRIRIELSCTESEAIVVVEDEGPGIPPERLGDVFAPFFTTKSGGTGLGLAVCSEIVQRHGGTIEASNRTDRSGARFVVRLPRVDGIVAQPA